VGIREFKREFIAGCGRDCGRVRVAIANGKMLSARLDGNPVFYSLFRDRVKAERRMKMMSVAASKNVVVRT
jgi:hypothetical protein